MAEVLGRVASGGPEAVEAVAFLGEVLDSPDLQTRLFAERVLGSYGPAAAAEIPRLVVLSREPAVRGHDELASIAATLGRIAPRTPGQDQALGALLEMLDLEPRSPGIETVIEAVARFGPAAAAALPRLRKLAASGDPAVDEASRRAVAAIEGPGQHTDGAASSPARPRVGHSSSG